VDVNPYRIERVDGPKTITIKNDYRIIARFVDPITGETIEDRTGERSVLVSTLLETLPSEALSRFVDETAIRMALIASGFGGAE